MATAFYLAGFEKHALGLINDLAANLGHLDVYRTAFKEQDAQLLFKLLDGDGKRWLTDMALLGSTSEMALLRQSHDITQIGESHDIVPAITIRAQAHG